MKTTAAKKIAAHNARVAETLASYEANLKAGNLAAAAGDRDALVRLGRM